MTFEKGHKPHATKKGAPGRSPDQRKAMRSLAIAVREGIHVDVMRDWHIMIAMGKAPRLDDTSGDLVVIAEEKGAMAPTLDQRTRAIQWLADRGHGLPAQHIHLEAELRAQLSTVGSALPSGALTPAQMRQIQTVLRPALTATNSSAPAPAIIDAESVDLDDQHAEEVDLDDLDLDDQPADASADEPADDE